MGPNDIALARSILDQEDHPAAPVFRRIIDRAEQSLIKDDTRSARFSAALAIMARRNGGTLVFTDQDLEDAPFRAIDWNPGLTITTVRER